MHNLSLETSLIISATVNNPEIDPEQNASPRDVIEDEGMMNQMFRMDNAHATVFNPEDQGRQTRPNFDVRPNFSQVIAEAVQDIITRYNNEAG